MEGTNVICPVCTLYLRPGMTLKSHLSSHPKQKVIDALVKIAEGEADPFKPDDVSSSAEPQPSSSVVNPTWNPSNFQPMQGNHVFIYQQSMSTTAQPPNVLNMNPLSPQYVIPTVFNHPQMMPYVYQQQQVIMSSNACAMKALPYALPKNPEATIAEISDVILTEDPDSPKPDTKKITAEEEDDDSSSSWRRSDLNKACQTQIAAAPQSPVHSPIAQLVEEEQSDYFFVDPQTEQVRNVSAAEPLYSNPNIHENVDYVEVDGMHVLIGDFASNQIISQVENFDNSTPERPGVLMTIGDIVKNDFVHREVEESLSSECSNVNIRADERMPARGELSGQESMGGVSDITWNRIQYHEGSSGMSTSYDLLARESWASDSSDMESSQHNVTCANCGESFFSVKDRREHEMQFHNSGASNSSVALIDNFGENQFNDDNPTIVSFSGPPLNFKCSTCGDAFINSKERKEHEIEKHPDKIKRNSLIGSEIGKKRVKKLTVKLKTKTETEPNFVNVNVFTNKLKLEVPVDTDAEPGQDPLAPNVKVDDANMPLELKIMCPICDCVFPNAKALKLHKIGVHQIATDKGVRYKCTTCSDIFPTEYKYTEHLKVHPLECRLCGKLFFRRQNLQLHTKRHLGLKPYKCETCGKCFVTKQKHDEHRNTHTGEAPIKCPMCDETFKRHSNLVQHRNRHHFNLKKKLRDYICFCGEIFHSKKKLAWHKEIHDAKPKSCTQCSEKFIHMSSLTRHMRRAHNEKFLPNQERDMENVECPICKGTYLRSSLDVHIRNHSGQRPFTCLICNKDFTTKWNLKLHKWTHAARTSKPYKCDQCKGAFIRESDYIAHMNSHKSVRPYTCNYCGAQFIRKYNCQRHVKEHENRKPYDCKVCGKSFHRSYYLKDHMRVHSGVRPYSCHICGKTSTTKSNHNKHVQIHHAREPVSTEN